MVSSSTTHTPPVSPLHRSSAASLLYTRQPHEPPSAEPIALLADLGRVFVAALERQQPETSTTTANTGAETTFLTLVGHELRTPLTVIFGSLKLLEAKAGAGVNPLLLRSARRSVEHLSALIETLITHSKVRAGD